MSGFPKTRESIYDVFNTGHSSTSISAALGIAEALELKGDTKSTVVAVIGDGSLTGGLAYEALNNASKIKRNFIIILNDNNMSISENVGGLSTYLSSIRAGKTYIDLKHGVLNTIEKVPLVGDKIVREVRDIKSSIKQLVVPGMLFENMGITYLGPIDGHNIGDMVKIIQEAKNIDHAVVIHVCTKKGKGYAPAENNPSLFHGIGPFDPETGIPLKDTSVPDYTDIFADAICDAAAEDEKIVAITAAMEDGTGLKRFRDKYPDRFFDVGIAEAHAATFAAGLAAEGMKPYVGVYSSFLQRAYDEVLHDVCIQNLPVTFCIDRAGLVGNDGETHHGAFDISYLNTIPNMNIFAPKNGQELYEAVKFAAGFNFPLAIRYPRGRAFLGLSEFNAPIVFGKSEILYLEKDILFLAAGSMVKTAAAVRERLKADGYNVTLVNARFLKPIDEETIRNIISTHKYVVTFEENEINGGYGMSVLRFVNSLGANVKTINFGLPNSYVEHGSCDQLLKECGLDEDSLYDRLSRELK